MNPEDVTRICDLLNQVNENMTALAVLVFCHLVLVCLWLVDQLILKR